MVSKEENYGLLHLYHGDGKGKTTAAVGLAVRGKGAGLRVCVYQFLKGSDSGELVSLKKLHIPVRRAKSSELFYSQMSVGEKNQCRKETRTLFTDAAHALISAQWDLVILDEVLDAVNLGLLSDQLLLETLKLRKNTEVVVTGRNPSPALLEEADYVSLVSAEKHPFAKGITARRGIEF